MKSKRLQSAIKFSLALGFVQGCSYIPAVGPNYKAPDTKLADRWDSLKDADAKCALQDQSCDLKDWWKVFKDERLNLIIAHALDKNRDLKIARSRIEVARSERGIATAALLPTLDGSGSFSRSKRSESALSSTGGSTGAAGVPIAGSFSSQPHNLWDAGFDSIWELDIFGGLRRNREAATAEIEVSEESYRSTLISLLAEVARNYIELRSFQKRISVAEKNIGAQSDALSLVDARFKAGLTSELDVLQARAQLEQTRSQVPTLQIGEKTALYQLSVLCGENIADVQAVLASGSTKVGDLEPLGNMPNVLPVGLPSDLLRRRPDIRGAERGIAASTARIGVAIADLFPSFSITGNFGYQSEHSRQLFDSPSKFWNIGPGVKWPIFQGGRILENIHIQREQEKQAIASYEQTVLQAIAETEGAIVGYDRQRVRYDSLAVAYKSNKSALELSKELYEKGLADFLRVLDAERSTFSSQDELVQNEEQILVSLISVYKALGGGWDSPAALATQKK